MDRILKIRKKENGPRASSAPALELNTIIFIHVYWYIQQISGERLQDHWSFGFVFVNIVNIVVCVHVLYPHQELYRKVLVGKDQEKAQSEKDSHSKNQGGKKPN